MFPQLVDPRLMKFNDILHPVRSIIGSAMLTFTLPLAVAVDQTATPSAPPAPAPVAPAPAVPLSYGAGEVLQLARSGLGEDTIKAFVNNSGRAFELGASQIIYLRQQGVSDTVLAAMLAQHPKTVGPVPAPPPAPQTDATLPPPEPVYVEAAPAYVPPAPAYVAPEPVYVSPPPTYYSSYWYNPFPVYFSFGYGGYYRGGYYHGGYYPRGSYGGHPGGIRRLRWWWPRRICWRRRRSRRWRWLPRWSPLIRPVSDLPEPRAR